MSSNIKYVGLGEICEFINGDRGKNYPSANDFVNSGIPFINAGHIQSNKIDFQQMNYITREKFNALGSGKIKKNDILFCLRGSLGKNAVVNIDQGAIASSLVILRSKDNVVNSNYLLHYLNSKELYEQILKANNGSSQPNLSASNVKGFKIYLPEYDKQIRISEVLDGAKKLIDKRKTQIEALDKLAKSRFIEMFGDPFSNSKDLRSTLLMDLCILKSGKNVIASDLHKKDELYQYPCYGGNGIRGYVENYSHEGNYSLIGRQGALCGNVRYATGKFYATEHAVVATPKEDLNSYWLFYCLNLLNLNRLKTGAAQPGLNIDILSKVDIPLPDIALQNEFTDFISQIDKLKFTMEKSLKELENNFNSLIQKAFKGELFN